MNTWKLEEHELDLSNLRKQESLFAQGNGYFGWRGTFEEGGVPNSLEGCYLNGFYETFPIKYPETAYGYPGQGQTMLNVMNAKTIRLEADGEPVRMDPDKIREYHRELDFRTGVLSRSFVFAASGGKSIRVAVRRVVSFVRKHCGAIAFSVTPIDFSGKLTIMSALDTKSSNQNADKDPRIGTHLPENCFERIETGRNGNTLHAVQRTIRSGLTVACAAGHTVTGESGCDYTCGEQSLELAFAFDCVPGSTVEFEKYIAYCGETSLCGGDGDPLTTVLGETEAAAREGFDVLVSENESYLSRYWETAGIEINGDDYLQQGLRFNSFHLIQSVGKDSCRSVAAKGLTGEGYEGHYFWDTEIYVIPSFLYSNPEICRNLLEYRYQCLPAARERAREMGHKNGALFAWRTINGAECSAYFPAGTAQYHINGDIAVAVKNYVQVTGDAGFLEECGAEILFETARFWRDLGNYSEERNGMFCINCVTGPDEYTALVNNNFYTNRIARENLWYAHSIYTKLEEKNPRRLSELREKIGLGPEEPQEWKRAGDAMFFPYDEKRGVFLQDDSFAYKADWDFSGTPKEHYPLLLHYHPLVLYRHRVLKQADTVLADFMLDQYISDDQIKRDFDYYEPLTTHDSSLSVCIYSIVASRIGYLDKAYDYFLRSARTDLDDHKGNTKDGVHIANMAGTVMCIINGFAGVRQYDGRLELRPLLPGKWKSYKFRLRFRRCLIEVAIAGEGVLLTLLTGKEMSLVCWGRTLELTENNPQMVPLNPADTAAPKEERIGIL
ncbi:glycoside hydrolase family 65 protein [Breznakiella homolactica]|uniref:Glycoside hydrolase family 65 protein n=1 Tax=Breznakiella homolactica TaxID=2798577 RepID=A0A7T7XLB3_9SPIR|nr:glycosyl hydrolase family 65 protein [Breznakiella homolactica]QQO08476.1 hypothetical protein JFL75_16285 [Breznakiella homolactica]